MKKTAIYLLHPFILFLCCLTSPAQQNKIDSLLSLIKTDKPDTNQVIHSYTVCWEYVKTGRYDTALILGNQALILAQKLGFKKGAAASYNNIGIVYQEQGNYPDALKNHFASLKIREEIEMEYPGDKRNKRGKANSYNNIGIVYDHQGNYPDALINYFASLKIREEISDKEGVANCYNNIGLVYKNQVNYPDALKNFFASLKIYEETANKRGTAYAYNNIGLVYKNQGNYPDALKNYFISLEIKEQIGDKRGIASSCNQIGSIYVSQHKPKEGKQMLERGLRLCKEIGSKSDRKASYQGLARADSALGNLSAAFENYKLYIIYRDSLLNDENTKKTVQVQMQYEFDKKESLAKAEQEKKDLINEEAKRKQKMFLWLTVFGLAAVLTIALFIFRSLQLNKKKNRIITHQKQMVEKQKQIVEEKQKEILDSIHYARRIQQSLLTSEKYIKRNLEKLAR